MTSHSCLLHKTCTVNILSTFLWLLSFGENPLLSPGDHIDFSLSFKLFVSLLMFDSAVAVIKIFRVKELSIEILFKSANKILLILERKFKNSLIEKKKKSKYFLIPYLKNISHEEAIGRVLQPVWGSLVLQGCEYTGIQHRAMKTCSIWAM